MHLTKRFSALLLSLAAVAASAGAAERTPVTTDSEGNAYHLETEGMTRKGYVVYVWQLQNLVRPDANGALSIRSQVEFDCRFRKTRTMWMTLHSERDEAGKVLSSGMVASPEWVPVTAGAADDALLDYACRRIMR